MASTPPDLGAAVPRGNFEGTLSQGPLPMGNSIRFPEAELMARWLLEQELIVPNPLTGKVSPVRPVELPPAGSGSTQDAPLAQPTGDAEPSRRVSQKNAIRNQAQPVDVSNEREQVLELPPRRRGLGVPLAASSGDTVVLAENSLKKLAGKAFKGTTAGLAALNEEQTTDSIENLGPQRTKHAPPHHSAVNQPEHAPAIEPVF